MDKHWEILDKKGKDNVAWVYLLRSRHEENVLIECVDAFDPRYSAREKWVIILSSQKGCPVRCRFCDASFYFKGNLSLDELLEQLEVVITPHKHGDDCLRSKKIKLHFARMGEPALNPAVLRMLEELPFLYPGVNFIPTIATVAPAGSDKWFKELTSIKNRHYRNGCFQLQFSVNSTNEDYRNELMPVRKWSLEEISDFGLGCYRRGDRKVTLNFALAVDTPFYAREIMEYFDPEVFLVKITPVNPTASAARMQMVTALNFDGSYPQSLYAEIKRLEEVGFEVIISIGSLEEIGVGSNCGQLAFAEAMNKNCLAAGF